MRIDKYLKNARLIKRRTIAKEACDQGRIKINDKTAKAGSEVNVGDSISITFGNKVMTVKVLTTDLHVSKEASKLQYEVISEESLT